MAMKKKRRGWIWLIVLAVLLAAGWYGWTRARQWSGQQAAQVEYATVRAAYGDVTRTITGSGKLAAAGALDVEAEDGLKIAAISVAAGDAVSAGDVLLTYDPDSIRTRIDALYDDLSALDGQLMRRSTRSEITSPTGGRVKAIYAAVGDDLEDVMKAHGALLLLSADELMQVDFSSDAVLAIGKRVGVRFGETRLFGEVACALPGGYRVTLNDNRVPIGETAAIYDGDTKLGEGVLALHAPVLVYGTNGTVAQVNTAVDRTVYPGSKLFTLADAKANDAFADALDKRAETVETIETLYALLENPVLTAPEDGVVAAVRAAEGDTVEKVPVFSLHTGGASKMTVMIDELDVGAVSAGQPVSVTLDAFAGERFAASVTRISRLGTTAGSITTYAVEVTLPRDDRLWEGMNGSAVIAASRREHVLLLPIEAIHEDETGVYVYVQGDEAPLRRDIETGLSDGTNAEITSGLSEGDAVLYREQSLSTYEYLMQRRDEVMGGR